MGALARHRRGLAAADRPVRRLAGRGRGFDGPTATATGTPTATETGSSTTESPTETTSASLTPVVVETEAEVEDGNVEAGRRRGPAGRTRPAGRRGRRLDVVHVHGYDLLAEVSLDEPAVIVFRANAPGVFEVELEGADSCSSNSP